MNQLADVYPCRLALIIWLLTAAICPRATIHLPQTEKVFAPQVRTDARDFALEDDKRLFGRLTQAVLLQVKEEDRESLCWSEKADLARSLKRIAL